MPWVQTIRSRLGGRSRKWSLNPTNTYSTYGQISASLSWPSENSVSLKKLLKNLWTGVKMPVLAPKSNSFTYLLSTYCVPGQCWTRTIPELTRWTSPLPSRTPSPVCSARFIKKLWKHRSWGWIWCGGWVRWEKMWGNLSIIRLKTLRPQSAAAAQEVTQPWGKF